jgi:hypothetical protein
MLYHQHYNISRDDIGSGALQSIPAFGKKIFNGGHYSVKFRLPSGRAEDIAKVKKKYPEMKTHVTTTGFIIFGGTFPARSEFMNDCKRMLKINTPAHA